MPVLVWGAALCEGMALTLVQAFLPLYLRSTLGETRFLVVGAVVAVPALGTFVASNFWGGLSDVSGRLKPFILIGLSGYVLALAGFPLFRHGYGLLAWAGLASLFYGTLAPSLKTYITLSYPERRENALAYLLMSQSIGWLLGSFGGSRLLAHGIGPGFKLALWGGAAMMGAYLVLVAFLLREQRRDPAPARASRGWLGGVAADLASLYENPRLLSLCVLAFFLVAGNYITWGFFSVFYTEHLHAGMKTLGTALATSSIFGIAFFPVVGPLVRRFGGLKVLAVCATLYLVMYAGMALARNPLVAGVLFALPLYGMANVSSNTLASQYSTSAQRGGGLGVLNGTYALATVVGPLAGGALADRTGLWAIPWISFAFAAVAGGIAWRSALSRARLGPAAAKIGEVRGRNAD